MESQESRKRKRLRDLFKKHEEQEDLQNLQKHSEGEKENVSKILKVFNKEKDTEEEKKKTPEPELKTRNIFRIDLQITPKSSDDEEDSNEEVQEETIKFNGCLMREILDKKWDLIELEEGCLDELLKWDLNDMDFSETRDGDGSFWENFNKSFEEDKDDQETLDDFSFFE